MSLPLVMTAAGAQTQSPVSLLNQLIALVAAQVPGYTASLPGSLIEDLSSTATGALTVIDQTQVDLINSVTPLGANVFLLQQLGQIYGVNPGLTTNSSVNVVFTGSIGFIINPGFTVSDGVYQYSVVTGGVITESGVSAPIYCVATTSGSWAIPANSVNAVSSSVISGITVSCNNPQPGTPATTAPTEDLYRAQVLQSGLVAAQGTPNFIKSLLMNVPGVQQRLISIQQKQTPLQTAGNINTLQFNGIAIYPVSGWKIICGGGDPYQTAYAIYQGMLDISILVGSNIPGRNNLVNIIDAPDTYSVIFVSPVMQSVNISLTWGSIGTNTVSNTAIATQGAPALIDYINSITVGQPINVFALQEAFVAAITSLIPAYQVTTLQFEVFINGNLINPIAGTGAIYGDSEGYFFAASNAILITQAQ
jgi:hypothetical protein